MTDIENIYDDGVDVIVTLDDDFSYVIESASPILNEGEKSTFYRTWGKLYYC